MLVMLLLDCDRWTTTHWKVLTTSKLWMSCEVLVKRCALCLWDAIPICHLSSHVSIFLYMLVVDMDSLSLCCLISPPVSDSLRSGLMFLPRCFIYLSEREISKMRGPTGAKFCTMVSTRPSFIMPVQNFGAHTPKKFWGRKTCKLWPDFGRLRSLAANISETDEYIQNRIFIPSTAIFPALGETSTVKFGPVTLEISMLNRTHPKCIFWKTIFRPLWGAAPPNFYTR